MFTIPGWDTLCKEVAALEEHRVGARSFGTSRTLVPAQGILLQNALMHRSDHLEANSEMLKLLQQTHQSINDPALARRRQRMEGHLDVLSEMDPLRVELNYLAGTGDLTLVTDVMVPRCTSPPFAK